MAATTSAGDISWLPKGKHDVKVGQTITKALKARRGENVSSKVTREFYACQCTCILICFSP
jgi:hypothetical protein